MKHRSSTWRAGIALVLTALVATGAGAENLLRNASFVAAGSGEAPDYWSWQSGPTERADWPRCWRLDDTHFVSGTRSMRLADDCGKPVRLLSFHYRLPAGGDYTFSAYMKADRAEARVTMFLGDVKPAPTFPGTGPVERETFTIGPEWKRCVVSGSTVGMGRFFSCVAFQLEGNATVWINAPQLEEGAQATAFAASPRDNTFPWTQAMVAAPHETHAGEVTAFLDRSFYTNEKQATLRIRSAKPGQAQVSFRGATQSAQVVEAPVDFNLDLGALPAGDHRVDVTVAGVSREIVLKKLPPAANAVKIDRVHRMLRCGDEPAFIPFATTASTPAEIDDLAARGFNTVITLLHHETRVEP